MRSLSDERGVLMVWFAKFIVGLAVATVFALDSGAIVVNYFGLDSAAEAVAVAVSSEIGNGSLTSPLAIRQAAVAAARREQAKLLRAHLDAEDIIHIRLRRSAQTLVVEHVEMVRDWATATAAAQSATG